MQDCQTLLENMMKRQNRCKLYQRILDDNLVNIIGGCCGTTQNISSWLQKSQDYKPSFDGGDVMRSGTGICHSEDRRPRAIANWWNNLYKLLT
jgi:hypothetical protein